MQNYNKIQKFISFFLIFSILFSFTINIKFFGFIGTLMASDMKYYNLVSIFVQEDIYSSIQSQVQTYAKNIQNTLENTKTIIIPTSTDEQPFNIASVNEKLYFEGDQIVTKVTGNSKLIGSVFIGNLALPVVENNGSFEKTIFPYVDFEDKLYIYNHEMKRYQLNTDTHTDPKAEIWHGFISPNTGDKNQDIQQIKDYFSKNSDYYNGIGNFQNSKGISNGKQTEELLSKYEPYVFYFDQFRESKSVKYVDYKAYQSAMDYSEDLSYNRFSTELADTLKGKYLGSQSDFIGDVSSLLPPGVDPSILNDNGMKNVPDIQSRKVIQTSVKKFLQIFNESALGDFRKDIHNAGRYNSGASTVQVDMIPSLITTLDAMGTAVLKNVNNELEKTIDLQVKNKVSKDIIIPESLIIKESLKEEIYTNFLYGQQAKNITTASGCTIYRGSTYNSGNLVQANRAFNINRIQSDLKLCMMGGTQGYWGGNSPLNLDSGGSELWKLKSSNYKNAILPLFDILGSLKSKDTNKNPSPNHCFNTNLLLTYQKTIDTSGDGHDYIYSVPINGNAASNWSCNTTNILYTGTMNYTHMYNNFASLPLNDCETITLQVDGLVIKTRSDTHCHDGGSDGNDIPPTSKTYNFHKVKSWFEHKSPTADELAQETKYMITPNLPIDRDRYIDFIGSTSNYVKINYPYLMRVILDSNQPFSLENAKNSLKTYLDKKSKELKATGINIDLYTFLQNKPNQTVTTLGGSKVLSYIDTLIFSIYWNNLNSVSAKYKFIVENYLSDQFGGNDLKFFLPKNKSQYEIAYLGAPGDAKNMYVKLDPEDKGENPYANIISQNLNLNNYLLGNKGNNKNNTGNFKCAPPEGVPIWKWIPAVICRLKDMLPPKISISEGGCGLDMISYDNGNTSYLDNLDLNKNGINDFLEQELQTGKLELKSDAVKYYYNRVGNLEAKLLNASGSVITFDNFTNVSFQLLKVEIASDDTKPFNEFNKKTIYDNSKPLESNILNNKDAYNEVLKYISFKDLSVVVKNGVAKYSFATKSKDVNIIFRATATLKDQKGNRVITKISTDLPIQVRGDLLYASNYKLSNYAGEPTLDAGINTIRASSSPNIFLIEENDFHARKGSLAPLNSISSAKDKSFITLKNTDKKGNNLPIAYPLTINASDENHKKIIEPTILNNLNNYKDLLPIKKSGTCFIEIKDKNNFLIKKEIQIIPDTAITIKPQLSTSLIEKGGVITTNVFSILDQFDNLTAGENYQVEASIGGNSVTFEDGSKKINFQVFDGYKPFRLKSTEVTGSSSITFKLSKAEVIIDTKIVNVSVVDTIDFSVDIKNTPLKVGNNTYNYDLKIGNTSEAEKFNSRAYLISNSIYILSNQEYIDIKNNTGSGSFQTKTKAGEGVKLEFKIEGVKNSIYKDIAIKPDLPVKVDIGLSKSKIEASPSETSQLFVDLKDRYNNVVWNDNSTNLTLEILNKYSSIIKANTTSKTVVKGKATFELQATNMPGSAFFKVGTNPSLSQNKIEFIGQSPFPKTELDSILSMRSAGILTITGKQFFEEYDLSNYRFKYYDKNILQSNQDFKNLNPLQKSQLIALFDTHNKLIIPGVGENAGKIETFYFWNKNNINGKKYNALYTTLLGANYGDITQKDNLANSILFDKNNRSLAVTSLLNSTDNNTEVLQLHKNGNVTLNTNTSDLSQDITTSVNLNTSQKLELSFYNNTFEKLVTKIDYNVPNFELLNCTSDIKSCIQDDKNRIGLKSLNKNYTNKLNEVSNLSLETKNGEKLLEIFNNGKIIKSTFISLEMSKNYTQGLVLDVKYNGLLIANLALKLKSDSQIQFIRNSEPLTTNGMNVYLESKDYYPSQKYIGSSTKEDIGYSISYNDPFATESSNKSNNFGANFTKPYETFANDKGLGWSEDNKILLSFSAGKNVGDATKDYMSFSLINLGDPVMSLKQIKKKLPGTTKDRKFDSSIGYLLSKDEKNIAYNTFDYNKDGIIDVVLLKRDGYVELLEGTNDIKNFIHKGNLIYLPDLSGKPVLETGDFTGDGYDDIVVLSKNRQPILLNNEVKDFTRINLDLKLQGTMSQIIAYDMDLDGMHDLVTLDDNGDIYIHYGTSQKGIFTKKIVDNGLGIKIDGGSRKDGGALYFEGLYQIPDNKQTDYVTESNQLLASQKALESQKGAPTSSSEADFNEGMVDKLIFTQMSYGNYITSGNNKTDVINNLPDLSTMVSGGIPVDNGEITDFINTTSEELNPGKNEYDPIQKQKITTFIKSEYAEYEGVTIQKTFVDQNGGSLKGGDSVKLDIVITNTSGKTLSKIAYVDKIPPPFKLSDNTDYGLNIATKVVASTGVLLQVSPSEDFTFLLDSYKENDIKKTLSLNNGESIHLTLLLDTNAFEYGYIEARLFDSQTEHGDIIFKPKNENCGKPYNLYASTSVRTLVKKETQGVCKNELPDSVKKNAIDDDNNGVPDYIDKLVAGGGTSPDMTNYATDALDTMNKDSDGDGIIDSEDMSPNKNNEDDFMSSLGNIDANVEEIMAGIDTILDGLSCGFGGGGCIASPFNAAPLAPGSSITMFGFPIAPAFPSQWGAAYSGIPVFAAMTWLPTPTGPIPFIWPPSPIGAGGIFGESGINNFRLFITPTLTGAVGVAACFGPAYSSYTPWMPGVSPVIPGGNCIVAAAPLFGCKDDGSDGEISNKGDPNATAINGNCSGDANVGKTPYLGITAKEYLQYKKTGTKTPSLMSSLKDAFSKVAKKGEKWTLPSKPLLNIGGSGESDFDLSVDFGALKSGNFEDVIKIKMTRISAFPDFLMDWVTRQIEEIANKLTDFPTIYIILPDFSGIFDSGWGDFIGNLKNKFSEGEQKAQTEQSNIQSQIDTNNSSKPDCEKDQVGCYMKDLENTKLQARKNIGAHSTVGGIKAAYEFMSNLPMINIETQKVNFNLPWIDQKTLDKALFDFEATKKQWTDELKRAETEWSLEKYTTVGTDTSGNKEKITLKTRALIDSIDKNIEIINDYKKLPEKIHKLISIKEIRINQILCNIETLSKITGGRIGDNGKRFKAWVELYILIKAILKSWQLLVDVFIDYSASCHQCKNERGDLMHFLWKLISMIIPKIPVIQFPKWPDVYIDLHNIRVQLNIGLPEFEFNLRPILLPTLPRLYLSNSPNININLPTLPLLPRIELADLPDLPSLPKIELPNLPPPPKLPKLFGAIEGVLKILKLVTKIMCILKTSPFVPEWRAGDQIAFITERTGYLSLDFLDISLPQFSFPFVDAIKVTTYVNLEMDVEFLVEMARQTALPLNTFTNDIVNMLNIGIGDLDFRNLVPEEINIGTSYNITPETKQVSLSEFASLIALNILKLHKNIKKDGAIEISNEEFRKIISAQLANIGNEKMVGVWQNALNYSFTKEDTLIADLLKNNENKFNEIKSILNEEKEKNNFIFDTLKTKLEQTPTVNTLMNTLFDANNYNTRLEIYNQAAVNSIKNILNPDVEVNEIKKDAKNIVKDITLGLESFSQEVAQQKLTSQNRPKLSANISEKSLSYVSPIQDRKEKSLILSLSSSLLAVIPGAPNTPSPASSDCAGSIGGYSFVYQGIYIIEEFLGKKISYRLFDMIDGLTGKEKMSEKDFDTDGDKDIIYMVGNEVFIKENLNTKPTKIYYTGNPRVLKMSDNIFYKHEFIESVNGLNESISDNGYIDVKFSDSTNPNISNYQLEFFDIVDKFDDFINPNPSYKPINTDKYIIDGFRDIDDITIPPKEPHGTSDTSFIRRTNLAYIKSSDSLLGVELFTKEIINLKKDNSDKEVSISAGTQIYTGNDSTQLTYYFYKDKDLEIKNKVIPINSYSNMSFSEDIRIVSSTNDVYVEGKKFDTFSGNKIFEYIQQGIPLFPGTKITRNKNEFTSGNIIIKYYDLSETIIDLKNTQYYELYDLGNKSDTYLIRTAMKNNFYYIKARSFQKNRFSTYSNQVLLSPQKESDTRAPEILDFSAIKVPVYQKKIINMSQYIFEDSGVNNIQNISIDFDGEIDTNHNGDFYDDKDYEMGKTQTGIEISKEGGKIFLNVGPFDRLYDKKIRIHMTDSNSNTGYKDIGFIIYSPIPSITSVQDNKVINGKIDESLGNEPVDFYRIRGGSIDKLKGSSKNTAETIEGGKFNLNLGVEGSLANGLSIKQAEKELFTVDEVTGKINKPDFDSTLSIKIYASNNANNDGAYPKIIVSKNNIPIYHESISLPNIGKVEIVEDFKNLNKIGVYYKQISNNYAYFQNPLGITQNPGDIFIYQSSDTTKTPVFKIFKDGRIETLGDVYYLEYDTFDTYIVYNLRKVGVNDIIGKVMIIPEKNYILK